MPTSTVPSGRVRSHSWVFVYLRSEGTLLMRRSGLLQLGSGIRDEGSQSRAMRSTDECLAVTDKRRPHDARVMQLAANIDLHAGARRGRHTGQRDRALQGRGKGSAGGLAFADI